MSKDKAELKAKIKRLQEKLKKDFPSKAKSKSYGRTKGLAFERDIANELKEIFPEIRRQLEFQVQDAKGVDLQGCDPFKIQCKKYADYVPISTIKEIELLESNGDIPVLVSAGTNKEAMAVVRFRDLKRLIAAYMEVEYQGWTKL